MKKFLSLLLCLVGAISYANADTAAYKTLEFSSITNKKNNYTDSWVQTCDGFSWTLDKFNNNNGDWKFVKCGNKKNASVCTITTNTVIDKPISSVAVTIDAITVASVNSIKLYVSSSSTDTYTEVGSFTKAKGTQTVEIPEGNIDGNLFYEIRFDCKIGSSNGLVQISKVEYFAAEEGDPTPTKPAPTASFAESTIEFDCGIADEIYPKFTTNSDGNVTFGITEGARIENDGSIAYINNPGTYTITASVEETDNFAAAKATCVINAYNSLLKTATFNFNENTYGMTAVSDNSYPDQETTVSLNEDISLEIGTNCRLFKSTTTPSKTTFRIGKNQSSSLVAQDGCKIFKIEIEPTNTNNLTIGELPAQRVSISNSGSAFAINSITVTYGPENPVQTLTIGSEGMTTFSSKNALDFSNAHNITAWVTREHDLDEGVIYLEQVTGTVKGGTGLILMGNPGATEDIPVVASGDSYEAQNLLVKWYAGATINANDGLNYVLAKIKNSPDFGFMNITNNLTNKTGIHHSYLHILDAAGNSPALRVVFGNGDTTGINDITVDNANEDGEMYNILGQKVDSSYRGFVIKNGEKFINK